MYEVTVETGFSAAHRLENYRGKCENLHGHNWKVRITAEARELDDTGIAMDFRELKQHAGEIMETFDHRNLSDLPEFSGMNPTTENIARLIYEEMEKKLEGKNARMKKVSVSESDTSSATYGKNL